MNSDSSSSAPDWSSEVDTSFVGVVPLECNRNYSWNCLTEIHRPTTTQWTQHAIHTTCIFVTYLLTYARTLVIAIIFAVTFQIFLRLGKYDNRTLYLLGYAYSLLRDILTFYKLWLLYVSHMDLCQTDWSLTIDPHAIFCYRSFVSVR